MWKRRSFHWVFFAILVGMLIGSAVGEVLSLVLPDGVVKEFFLRSVSFGLSPFTIDLVLITLTFGLTLTLNIVGVIGIIIAVYILRWYM
jgi:hypothetical protein